MSNIRSVVLVYYREAGVGCSTSPGSTAKIDSHREELLKLLVTAFSEVIYLPPTGQQFITINAGKTVVFLLVKVDLFCGRRHRVVCC